MAKIIGVQKRDDTTELTLELANSELKSVDLNNPVIILSKNKLDFKASTHQVPSKSGKSFYILLPVGLRKVAGNFSFKEKQVLRCGLIETAEGGYIIYKYDN